MRRPPVISFFYRSPAERFEVARPECLATTGPPRDRPFTIGGTMKINLFARRGRPRWSPGDRPPPGFSTRRRHAACGHSLRRTNRALALAVSVLLPLGLAHGTAFAQVAATGNGFTVTPGDLA